jgi:hypothetical protein
MIWPKRVVSSIDYFDEEANRRCKDSIANLKPNPANPDVPNVLKECIINNKNGLTVLIEYVSSSVAESFDTHGKSLSKNFQNNIIEGLPFGVDICLDYSRASLQKDKYRMAQLDEREFKLDFLIAAGMNLNIKNYASTPYIQYAIRNEGYGGLKDKTGELEVWKLHWTKGDGDSLGTMTQDDLAPLDAASASDTKKGEIVVDETDAFVSPAGIPNILDGMNPGIVKIWQLDVDQPDDAIVASNPPPVKQWPIQSSSLSSKLPSRSDSRKCGGSIGRPRPAHHVVEWRPPSRKPRRPNKSLYLLFLPSIFSSSIACEVTVMSIVRVIEPSSRSLRFTLLAC